MEIIVSPLICWSRDSDRSTCCRSAKILILSICSLVAKHYPYKYSVRKYRLLKLIIFACVIEKVTFYENSKEKLFYTGHTGYTKNLFTHELTITSIFIKLTFFY